MIKIYHLSTCDTCRKIIKQAEAEGIVFTKQDIKTEPISAEQLDELKALSGSYESLFSRRSQKFRPMGLHERTLTEEEYRTLILQEYSFLKRPVIISGSQLFIGNTAKVVAAMIEALK